MVRAGTVTAAAEGVASRRSLMSRQIGELEKTLGYAVFRREGKKLFLTEPGRELALLAASFFREVENSVSRATSTELETIRIAAGGAVFEAMVFPHWAELGRQFPGRLFEFVSMDNRGIIQSLQEGQYDFGLISNSYIDDGSVVFPCGEMKFVLVVRKDFDSNLQSWTSRELLARVPLATISGNGEFVRGFKSLCNKEGVQPRIIARASMFAHVRDMIENGVAGGVLPEPLARRLPESDFMVVDDALFGELDRKVSLVASKRAIAVRDRLTEMAATLTDILKSDAGKKSHDSGK